MRHADNRETLYATFGMDEEKCDNSSPTVMSRKGDLTWLNYNLFLVQELKNKKLQSMSKSPFSSEFVVASLMPMQPHRDPTELFRHANDGP